MKTLQYYLLPKVLGYVFNFVLIPILLYIHYFQLNINNVLWSVIIINKVDLFRNLSSHKFD